MDYDTCPVCGGELEKEYIKLNDNGGYDFHLGIEYSCDNCGYERTDC